MFARSLLVTGLVLGLSGCAPYRPPPEVPALAAAREPVRILRAEGPVAALSVVVRAGSAYDPPSREGLSFVLAQAIAAAGGATVEVGPELVIFRTEPGRAAHLAEALGAPIAPEALAAAVLVAQSRLRDPDCASLAASVGPAWIAAGHPYGHAVAGRLSVLPTLTPGELQAFRSLRYVRGAAVLAVTGTEALPAFEAVFAPALSPPVTPTVRPVPTRPDLRVVAPVAAPCTVSGPRRLDGWSARDEAVVQVEAALRGAPPPAPRVDPAWWWSVPAGERVAPTGPDFEAAKSRLTAQLSAPSAEADAVDLLLTSVRGSTHPERKALVAALDALTAEEYGERVMWLAAQDPVFVTIGPDTPAAGPESTRPPGVLTREEVLR